MEKVKMEDHNLERKMFALPHYEIPFDKFFQFGLSVDCVVFGYHDKKLKVLLIKRGAEPFKGDWALPGDLVYPNENIDFAAQRVLNDLTGISSLYLDQTKVYGEIDRHPSGRVVTTGYYSLVDISKYDPHASKWAEDVYWVDVDELPKLAFDHDTILHDAIEILRRKVRHMPIGFELLPKKFPLAQLQELYEALLGEKYDKANFRKRIKSQDLLVVSKEMQQGVSHRPARLYSFDVLRYEQLKKKGFSFGL